MKEYKKKIIKTTATLFSLILLLGLLHAIVLPQQTNCHLIGFQNFKKDGNLYYRKGTPKDLVKQLKLGISQAEKRIISFWGKKKSYPTFIYCNNSEDYKKFGSYYESPACAHMEISSYIVINKNGVNLDIIAHELNHTELYSRIGHFKKELEIPAWFDEGLAMQVDLRKSYSTDTLKQLSNNFVNLPAIKEMRTYTSFSSGTNKEVHLNYATAKYEVKNWLKYNNLRNFIKNIEDGMSFNEAYDKK